MQAAQAHRVPGHGHVHLGAISAAAEFRLAGLERRFKLLSRGVGRLAGFAPLLARQAADRTQQAGDFAAATQVRHPPLLQRGVVRGGR